MSEVILNPGEELCPKCLGGKLKFHFDAGYYTSDACPMCLGEGKMDWIEMAVGKKKIDKFKINTAYGMFGIRNPSSFSIINLNTMA